MKTKVIKCKLFLEGVEVDFNSITISESVMNTPVATVSFPASSSIPKVLPKTICEVYYLEDGLKGVGAGEKTSEKNLEGFGNYVQIFQGELSGYAMSSTVDKRSVDLTFNGFIQNFANTPIVPVDVNLPTMLAKATYIIASGGASPDFNLETKTADISSLFSVLSQLLLKVGKGDKDYPRDTISKMFKPFFEEYIKNVYLKAFMDMFKFNKQIFYADPYASDSVIAKTMSSTSFKQSLTKQGTKLEGETPLDVFIFGILQEIGFHLQEFAAPTYVNGDIRRIYIKPETVFFEPIKCNTVFNNDVNSLVYQRNIDLEPTRFIRQSNPYAVSGANQYTNLILSTIVPANVYVGQSLGKQVNGNLTNTDLLGLTLEERLRGVLLKRGIPDSMENGYMLAAASSLGMQGDAKKIWETLGTDVTQTKDHAAKSGPTNVGDPKGTFFNTAISQTYLVWQHERLANRAASVTTAYNPYRMIGFVGTIMTNDYPTITGMLSSITSVISADGQATQNLNFTHCQLFDLEETSIYTTELDKELYEANPLPAPPWYADYTKHIDDFYKDMTGRKGMSIRWGVDVKKSEETKSIVEPPDGFATVREALVNLYAQDKQLNELNSDEKYQEFAYNYTRRELVPQDKMQKLYEGDLRNIVQEFKADTTKRTINTNKSIYVMERRERVLNIFVAANLVTPEVINLMQFQPNDQ